MTLITVTVFHNAARGQDGRPTALLDGFTPGDPVVRVFTCQIPAGGQSPEAVAEDAFAAFNGHPRDAQAAELSRRYYQRQLRSLSFPGNRLCCPRSCCPRRGVVWLSLDAETEGPVKADSWRERARRAPAGREMGR